MAGESSVQPSVQPSRSEFPAVATFEQGFDNHITRRNTLIFGVLMLIIQIGFCFIYGFLFNVSIVALNIRSVLVTIFIAVLVVAGFGLLFGYLQKLVWSGLGFTLFITAFCLEFYPLVNAFWTKTQLQTQNSPLLDFTYDQRIYSIVLTDSEVLSTSLLYGNNIVNAFKCALSVAVAFSAIIGRAGQLECLLVTIVGTIGYELLRQITVAQQGYDGFGTFTIFTFGGFMGLAMGLILKIREKNEENSTFKHGKNTANEFSASIALFGTLIIFALFPVLAYSLDQYNYFIQNQALITNPICIILGMGAGALGALCVSSFVNGKVIARDFIHGPIAGAVAVGAASMFIANPTYAVLTGFTGGFIQAIIQNLFEKQSARNGTVLSTISWSLFGVQGIIGAAYAAGYKAIVQSYTNNLAAQNDPNEFGPHREFLFGLIAAGFGLGFGIIAGFLVLIANGQKREEHFDDTSYWITDDGISTGIVAIAVQEPEDDAISCEEGESLKNQHAYL